MNHRQKRELWKLILSGTLFAVCIVLTSFHLLPEEHSLHFLIFLPAYLIASYSVLWKAVRAIPTGHFLDENFLMAVASIGAMCTGEIKEAVAVMLFYGVGELFQSVAVGKSRKSISALLDIMPESAAVEREGKLLTVDPSEVEVGETILVKPGEKIPLDGKILTGASSLDTAALTGESLPRTVTEGDTVLSGCINMDAALRISVTAPFADSTVSRILSLVEESASRKAKTENFITKFARYYTPAVVIGALLVAVLPPLFLGIGDAHIWRQFIHAAMVFLVISCPCALVISVPMAFFGGVGGASSRGILVKGSNYLELLASCRTVVMDKTGTLTKGVFSVTTITPAEGVTEDQLLAAAAYAESCNTHPIARSILRAYTQAGGKEIPPGEILSSENTPGKGVRVTVRWEGDLCTVTAGSEGWIASLSCTTLPPAKGATAVHVAVTKGGSSRYLGVLSVSDSPKEDARTAVDALRLEGVEKIVMLTGDREETAAAVAETLGITEYRAGLLPGDKVDYVKRLLAENGQKKGRSGKKAGLAFVGDGINDAPVLSLADVGIAMGALGSDAAIEAADVVLADDKPSRLALAIRIAKKTLRIARQNIVLALAVKALVLAADLFSAFSGTAAAQLLTPYMAWFAVFADVGVAVIAILNAMRTMRVKSIDTL